jgi:hypothetical protein
LLDRTGAPLASTACSEIFTLDDRAGTEARLGVYVELASGTARTSAALRYVALASDAARDGDADGVPEVLDNCPNDWNAAQAECAEEPDANGGAGGEGGASDGGAGASNGGAAGDDANEAGEGGGAGETPSPTGGTSDGGTSNGGAGMSGNAGASGGAGVSGTSGLGGTAANGGTGAAAGSSGASGTSGNAGSTGAAAGAAGSSATTARNSENDSGCGCRAVGERHGSRSPWLALALGVAVLQRRRSAARRVVMS